jgi:hypothetical protein
MTFIETIPEDEAGGATAHWYAADHERLGYQAFARGLRPSGRR